MAVHCGSRNHGDCYVEAACAYPVPRTWTTPAALPQVVETVNGHAEADWLAVQLRQLERHGHDLREVAVLFRVHLLSRVIEQALVRPLLLPPQLALVMAAW